MSKYDITIIGGGIMGSFVAYFLAHSRQAGSIAVIEPDSSYRLAATPNGAGGIRQLFSQPENIWMSQFSLDFYSSFDETMAVDSGSGDSAPAGIDFNQRGYLFVVGEEGAKQLEANHARQSGEGVKTELLDRADLATRFPSLGLDDIALGCLSPEDATITTRLALQHLRRKVEQMGVQYLNARVVDLETDGNRLQKALLDSGKSVAADVFVNAAGAWASQICDMVGMTMPVEPMCRVKHFWTCDHDIEPLPLIKDETALFFRPQKDGFVGGCPTFAIKPGFNFASGNESIDQFFDGYFERVVRPLLVDRLPAFSSAKERKTWVGHYAQNTLDGNMILGPWLDELPNFYVACGFSGHGIMHAPAVGMALAELILDGRYSTMDLSRMSYQRVVDNAPYPERGII